MNRVMIWATALLLVVAAMTDCQEANAFGHRKNKCCKQQKCKQGLFAKRKASKCCAQESCCAPEPTCCEAPVSTCCSAPVIEAAPSCGCSAPVIEATPACGCSAAVEAAPACGCQVANCDCLNKRQLRRANRKGECCDAQVNTCSSCSTCDSASVQTASYEVSTPIVEGCSTCGSSAPIAEGFAAPAVEGCSTCGGSEVIIESAPTPAAASEEAAPEAPESDSTT